MIAADTSAPLFGVVLAAGRSSRFGSCKALAVWNGKSLVEHALDGLVAAGVTEVRVVVAAPHAAGVRSQLARTKTVENPEPDRGMTSSLAVGLGALLEAGTPRAVLVSLVDHPRVTADTLHALVQHFDAKKPYALRPTHAGRGGHPIVLSPLAVADVVACDPTRSFRQILGRGLADLPVADPFVLDDVDTAGALETLGRDGR